MEPFPDLWRPGAASQPLDEDSVHVWAVWLDLPDDAVRAQEALLSPDETARAARYRYRDLAREFILGRAALRAILGSYLEAPAEKLAFTLEARGRPALERSSARIDLRFNLSNARDLALVAVTRGRQVGIDLESNRRAVDPRQIAAHFFAPAECQVLFALPEADQKAAFLNCWTRKEAYLKGRGSGLARALDRFEVTLRPGEPARLLRDETDPSAPARWSLAALEGLPGYTAALAVEAGHFRLDRFRFLWNAEHL